MAKNNITIGVTGAAGFIGSHLCEAFVKQGYKVIGLDDLSKGNPDNLKNLISAKNFQFVKSDIFKYQSLKKVLKDANFIVHLAAAKIPRYGGRRATLITNTRGTENILEIARTSKAKVIFISTSDVYGKNLQVPFSEEDNLVLGSPEVARWAYATSKIFDEHLCFSYWEEYKVPFVIIRLFGAYGPKQHRTWWGGPQALFIDKIMAEDKVEIHGNGLQTRTFIYIDDVISAIVKATKSKKAENQIINIGTTREISVLEMAKLIAKLIQKPLKIKKIPYLSFTGEKYEDVQRRVPTIEKAKKILNWQPTVSLEKGLKLTIEWHSRNPL